MPALLDGIPILTNIGAGTIVVATVWMILTGRLVPRRTLDDALANGNAWRKVAEEQAPQMTQLLASAHATDVVLRSLADAIARTQRESG